MLKISVIMPSLNQASFLRTAIDSIQSQQGDFDLEHIVVDGGSTDESVEILKSYGSRLKWVSEVDDGQSDALNKGLAMATGDVIAWLNSDDLYEPGAFAAVAGLFEAEPETQWLYGKVRIIDGDGVEIRRWITRYKNLRMRRYRFSKHLVENWISQMGVFWRRSAWEKVGSFRVDLHYSMDYDYWLRLGACWPGRFVDQYLAAFRWYGDSKSGSGFSVQFREEYEVAKAIAAGKYPWAIFKHWLNIKKIVGVYRLMRAWQATMGRLGRS